MVGQPLWKNLKNLTAIDKQLGEIEGNIIQTKKILGKDDLLIPKLEESIEKHYQEYLSQKKAVTQHEKKAQELKEKEKKEKEIFEKTTTEKEYKAAEKELKLISDKRIMQDDILIKAWHNLDITKDKYEKEKNEKMEQINQLKEGIQVQQKALEDSEKQKIDLFEKRKESTKLIPTEWLEKYEKMRHKVPDPIVPVLGTSCSACYYSILLQDLAKLKKAGVLPCRNCYRFLYYDELEEKEAKKASY
ncbi:hypothetical protein KAT08_02660 [Candidatus Babeliales bacterium]|nr:hypothetical protein [Candidatus Babeliales bacterium]